MGRAVKSIKFKIEERAIKQRLGIQNNTHTDAVIKTEEDIFKNLKSEHGEGRVEKAIQYVTSRPAYKNGEIKNMVGYVTSAVINGYEEKNVKAIKKPELSDIQKRNTSWILHKTEYCRYITPDVIKQFCLFDAVLQQAEFSEFMSLVNSAEKNNDINLIFLYKKLGENFDGFILGVQTNDVNAILFFENGFSEHLIKKHADLKGNVISLDEFLEG